MNLTGTLLDKSYHHKWIGQGSFCTQEVSENDVDIDTFGKKQNHNCSVIGSLLDTKLIDKSILYKNEVDRDPFGQIKSP